MIGFVLGGEPGAKAARELGIHTSPDTLIRAVRRAPLPATEPPRVLGVDDWAKRRGQNYGTILVDLERRRPVDLLPDREASTLASWLEQRPGIEVVARDRAKAYGEGASCGAPNAVQVADRFHLVKNLVDAFERVLNGRREILRTAAENISPRRQTEVVFEREGWGGLPDPVAPPNRPRAERERQAQARARREARYQEVHRLGKRGESISSIARQLGMHRETVRSFLAADTYPERAPQKRRASKVRSFGPYLAERWSQGCHNAAKLYGELRDQGYSGSRKTVCTYVRTWREKLTPLLRRLAELPDFTPLSPKQTVWLMLKPESATTPEQEEYAKEVARLSPQIAEALTMVQRFRRMIKDRDAEALDDWLAAVKAGASRELRSVAKGIEDEIEIVRAALTYEWSTGPVEGHIHRLKLIKRQTYGRAKFDLLRARVLYGYGT
jgi:transposase